MTRGEIRSADLGPYRTLEQTGRRPVIVWQSDTLTRLLQSVLVIPLTTNLDRARLAGSALITASEGGLGGTRAPVTGWPRLLRPGSIEAPWQFQIV